jgi:hypothetical protein
MLFMAQVFIPKCIKVALVFDIAGAEMVNTIYFQSPNDSPTVGECQLVADIVGGYVTANMHSPYANEVTARTIEVRGMDQAAAAEVIQPMSGSGTSGTGVVREEALTLTFGSGHAGRRNRGRIYVGGLLAAAVQRATDTWNFNTTAAVLSFWKGMVDAVELQGFKHVVASFTYGELHEVTTYVPRDKLATQKRRIVGRGV